MTNQHSTLVSSTDEFGVRNALEHYLRGHATGDATHMRKAFLATAHMIANKVYHGQRE